MKKNVFGRKLKRDANERKSLFKNLLTSLVLSERIKTSEAKAKAIRAAADKLITKAKKGGRDAYRALEAEVHHEAVVKLIDDLAGRFKSRNGGYTRIIKMGRRVADNAPIVMMEWVERASANANLKTQSAKLDRKEEKSEKKAKNGEKVKKTASNVDKKKKTEKKPVKNKK